MYGIATIGHKVRAVEYASPDGFLRAWWTRSDCDGFPLVAVAHRHIDQSEPWYVCSMRPGWHTGRAPYYPARYRGVYRTLVRARQSTLGGNGHVARGHSSVTEVREMSRANILALARG